MEKRTFAEIYEEVTRQPTPRMVFIRRVTEVTGKSRASVDNWIRGRAIPDELTRRALGSELGVDWEGLFPAAADRRSMRGRPRK